MLKLGDFSAVIFDMDGLVLDTETGYFCAWQQAASAMGYCLSETFCQSLSGLTGNAVTAKLLAKCGTEFDLVTFNKQASLAWHHHVQQHGIAVKHGFAELLNIIQQQGLPFCLASNSRLANVLECLALADLSNVFATIISRDDVQHGKPAPDIFYTAAHRLHVPIAQCLILEDSHAGVVAATTAGALTAFIPSTTPINPATVALCDVMLSDLAQLTRCLQV
jgi:beta-phosphoglucomutase